MPATPATVPVFAVHTWDLYCSLIDNFGDVGVSWRLAADLASRGQRVRLWADDPTPLNFMAPEGHAGVEVLRWPSGDAAAWPEPGDVVIELFGCTIPEGFIEAMCRRATPPVWLNLEYLSAESFVERSHGLPSPQSNGLPKWFFYPGFSAATGGLLREPGLLEARAAFDRDTWLAERGLARQPHERVVMLFCYPNPALGHLLQALGDAPTLLLATPGHAQKQVQALAQAGLLPPNLRVEDLPWLRQADFDRALWSADLNLVRGEDSLVRAIWAGAPFLWQVYPMDDEVRERKLAALLRTQCGDEAPAGFEPALEAAARHYCSLDGHPPERPFVLPPADAWQQAAHTFRARLAAMPDLVTRLQGFVATKRARNGVE